jgi:hypothetical protein
MGRKIETVKEIGGVIVGLGIGSIVNSIVKNNTSEEDGKVKKLTIWAGGIVLASIAADKGIKYFHNKVDAVVAGYKKPVEEEKSEEKKV